MITKFLIRLPILLHFFFFSVLIGCQETEQIKKAQAMPYELSANNDTSENSKTVDLDKSVSTSITSQATEKDFEFTTRENSRDSKGIDLVIVVDNSYSMHTHAPKYFSDHPLIVSEFNSNAKRHQSFTDKIQLIADEVIEKKIDGASINLTIITALDQQGFKPRSDGLSKDRVHNDAIYSIYPNRRKFMGDDDLSSNIESLKRRHRGERLGFRNWEYGCYYSVTPNRVTYHNFNFNSCFCVLYCAKEFYSYRSWCNESRVSPGRTWGQIDWSKINLNKYLFFHMYRASMDGHCPTIRIRGDNFFSTFEYRSRSPGEIFSTGRFNALKNNTSSSYQPCVSTMHKSYSTRNSAWNFSSETAEYDLSDLQTIYQDNIQTMNTWSTKFSGIISAKQNLDEIISDAPFYYLDKEFIENILNNRDTNTVNCIIEPLSSLKVLASLVDEEKFKNIQSSSAASYSDIFKEDHQKVFLVISDSFAPSKLDFDRIVMKKSVKPSRQKIDTKEQFQQAVEKSFGRSNVRFFSYSPKQQLTGYLDEEYKKPGSGAIRYTGYLSDGDNLERVNKANIHSEISNRIGLPIFSHAVEQTKYGKYYSSSYRDLSAYFNGDTTGHYTFDDLDFRTGVRENILRSPSDITSIVNKYLLHDSFSTREYQILKVTVDDIEIEQEKYSVVTDSDSNETFITFVEDVLDHSKVPQKVVVTAKLEAAKK